MTIQLVKAEDCKKNRQNHRHSTIEIKEEQLEQDQKSGFLRLVDKEECSTSAKLKADKMTKRQMGWAIRTGKINIPKWDKRYNCEYYDKENRSCSVYKVVRCGICKKNRLPKMNGYGWAHLQE